MIDDILTKVGLSVSNANSIYNTYFIGGRLFDNGEVVFYQNGEGEYQGLADTNANYFYIRYRGEADSFEAPIELRRSSCSANAISVPLRLVSWIYNADSDKVAKALYYDLNGLSPWASGYDWISPITIDSVQLDFEEVYKEETDKPEVDKMIKNLSLLYIDFTIECIPSTDANCVDRDFCNTAC